MKKRNAFTLMELMIVVAIIGILASIALPRFADLIDKSKEGYTKGALSTLRSAVSIYFADNQGKYPADDLGSLVAGGKYISNIPVVKLPRTTHLVTAAVATGASTAAFVTDSGGWAYVNNPLNKGWGQLSVNCSHLDIKGIDWSVF